MDGDTVFSRSDPLWRPAHVPRASDVVMRSLRPRLEGEEHASIAASKGFHVTRHEWTYLNYEMQGGSPEQSDVFIRHARREGILVGGAGSGSSHHVDMLTEFPREAYCLLEIDGTLYTAPHKRGWPEPPGQGSVFSDHYFKIHLEHYTEQLDMGAQTLQRDEAQMALASGYDFSQPAVEAFRDYLLRHFPKDQLNEWGIRNPDTFDVRAYFIGLGVPEDPHPRWFHGWRRDDPVKQAYDRFILEAVVGFYQRLRAALNDHAGRTVPFSCNNTSNQVWTPVHRQFDWAMSELMFRTANPQHLYDRFREGLGHGKVQVLSTPKPLGSVEDHEAFRNLNRKVIALAYALGGLCKTPWDLFLQTTDGKGRYFGRAADYADLYGFVRGMAPYLEGFEEAAAFGKGIPDEHGWNTFPIRIEGNDEACAFLRVRPRDPESPVVVHLVNWGEERVGLDLLLLKSALLWDSAGRVVRALAPAPYDERLHSLAERKQALLRKEGELRGPHQYPAYQHLIESIVVEPADEGGWIRLSGLSARPWTTIVIEKINTP